MSISVMPRNVPMSGERTMKAAIFAMPAPINPLKPSTGTVAPIIPPASACDEEEGRPHHHVSRFQAMAPINAAKMTDSTAEGPAPRSMSKLMMPLPMVLATWTPPLKAAMKLKKAAHATARFGDNTRVDTTVAMEFAASWKPLMKSKMRATPTIRMTAASSISGVLQHHALDDVRHALTLVRGGLDDVVDLLPLDDGQGIHAALEEPAQPGAQHLVRLRLQPLDFLAAGENLVRLLDEPQRRHHLLHLLRGHHQQARQLRRVGQAALDFVVVQPGRGCVRQVQHVVDARQQRVDLRPVERGDELLVQTVEGGVGDLVTQVLHVLERADPGGHIAIVAQQFVQHLRALNCRGALLVEVVEELIRLGHQPFEHGYLPVGHTRDVTCV